MYYEVASKLVTTGTAYTQAVSMDNANAIMAEFTNFGAGSGSLIWQEGNDLENWLSSGSAAIAAGTYGTLKGSVIASRYVRLSITATGGTTIILGAGINTAQL